MFRELQKGISLLSPGMIGILGIPFDSFSSFLRGASLAPARIRETFYSDSSNMCIESGFCLKDDVRWIDLGDLEIENTANAFRQIETGCAAVLERGGKLITLGGDHSITYPILRAYARMFSQIQILQFDAHADIYHEYDGNKYSHACPFARIMEEKLADRLVQVGVRTLTPHLIQQATRFGVEVIPINHWKNGLNLTFSGPVYLSFDMDALDPAFAPGVSHHEPGGFSTRDVLEIIQSLKGNIIGADIVEYNPVRDPTGVTGMVAVKLLKEILGRILGV